MKYSYRCKGTCSSKVEFELDSNTVYNVSFTGGCNGNLKGIASLVEGMDADLAIERLKGITCGYKDTSCPDQLARAIEEVKKM